METASAAVNLPLRLNFSFKIALLHSSISLARACLSCSKSDSYIVLRDADVLADKVFFGIGLKQDEFASDFGSTVNLNFFIVNAARDYGCGSEDKHFGGRKIFPYCA